MARFQKSRMSPFPSFEFRRIAFPLWNHEGTDQGHTGVLRAILSALKISTIEGNTGSDSMRDGDGVQARMRSRVRDGDLILQGYVLIFPNLEVPKAKAS